MEDNKKLLLLHKSMESMTLSENVDVMLTPQFYTIKKEMLPVRFSFQAKNIATSVFEGMLEEGKEYDYFVFKEGEYWVFIAYSLEEITDFLKSKGLSLEYISKLFFAEQSVSDFKTPYLLNEKEVLTVLSDTAVIMPKSAVEGDRLNTALDIQKPSKGISLESAYASALSMKQSLSLAAILILFALLFIVEGTRYGGDTEAGMQEFEKLTQANPSLESQYKRESIAAKYKKINSVEKRKREIVKILGGIVYRGVELQELRIDDKGFSALYTAKEKRLLKRIESAAKKEKFTVSNIDSGVKVEGTL